MIEYLTLVDENNNVIWKEEKLETHKKWLLHRAFSIFIFNDKKELLLQQRDLKKYHCPWLWTNTTCSHPNYWESYNDAVHRRIQEEMWFDCELKKGDSFIYKVEFDNWLIENEYDIIYTWIYNKEPEINPEEAMDYKWTSLKDLKNDIQKNPEIYSPWLKIILDKWLLKDGF